jgi:Sigma-54 interaction domain
LSQRPRSVNPNDRPLLTSEGQPSVDEWHVLLTSHPNVLLIGPDHATNGALLTLSPQLRQPMCWSRCGESLTLPTADEGTLILRQVEALDADQQQMLLGWLDESRVQVVSVTSEWLFSRVEFGTFLDRLYYRLNALIIEMGPSLILRSARFVTNHRRDGHYAA